MTPGEYHGLVPRYFHKLRIAKRAILTCLVTWNPNYASGTRVDGCAEECDGCTEGLLIHGKADVCAADAAGCAISEGVLITLIDLTCKHLISIKITTRSL